jgi:hypothetical protein
MMGTKRETKSEKVSISRSHVKEEGTLRREGADVSSRSYPSPQSSIRASAYSDTHQNNAISETQSH